MTQLKLTIEETQVADSTSNQLADRLLFLCHQMDLNGGLTLRELQEYHLIQHETYLRLYHIPRQPAFQYSVEDKLQVHYI